MTRRREQHNPYYQQIVRDIINQSLDTHARTAVIRFDLRFSIEMFHVSDDSKVITRFIESFKARLIIDLKRKGVKWGREYQCDLNYVWVREYGDRSNRKHYHVLFFLNKDVYHLLGDHKKPEGNLSALVRQAWTSANGLDPRILNAPVYFHNKVFYMDRNSEDLEAQIEAVVKHATYLTKYITKRTGDGNRSIGSSTIRR